MRRRCFLLLLILSTAFLGGCWGKLELNERSIVMGTGVDQAAQGYLVSHQIIIPQEFTRTARGAIPVTVYSATGNNILEAARKVTEIVPRRISPSHMRVLIIGEKLARSGVKNIFDLFERHPEIRLTTKVLIARDAKAEDVLRIVTPIEKIPANAIDGKLELESKVWSEIFPVEVDDVVRELQHKDGGPVISGITIVGNKETGAKKANTENLEIPAVLKISGMAMFKEDKLVGWLDDDNARGVSWIMNKMKRTIVNLDYGSKKNAIGIDLQYSKTKIDAKVTDRIPTIHIRVKARGIVLEADAPVDLKQPAETEKLQRQMNKEIKEKILTAFKTVQKEKTDVLGIAGVVERADPKQWKKIKKNWGEIFPECKVDVQVETLIQRTELSLNSLFKKK